MNEQRGRRLDPQIPGALGSDIDAGADINPRLEDPDRVVRVVVVDDHEIFADSLAGLLSSRPHLDVVGRAGTVARGVELVGETIPDIVLMDFELPDGDGPDATEQIKRSLPQTKVIMLTMRTDEHARTRALAAGCSGFVRKDQSTDSLLDAITAVARGEMAVAPSDLDHLLARLEPTHRGLGATITPRELEVLGLMAMGLVNKEIAQRLGLRLNTVRNHVQNILYKLEVHSQLEAVATAVREGLIRPAGR